MVKPRAILPPLLLAAAPMAMLFPLWSDPVSAGEDDVVYYYPLRKMVGEALRQGRLPATTPLEAAGGPLLADPQSAVMHPTTWLFAVVHPKAAYLASLFAAFAAAGAGAYFYLRRLGLVAAAATFGALALMFSGFMVGHRVHLGIILAAAMLPWGLLCIELLRSRPRAAALALAGVVFLALAAGHWPTFIHLGLIWTAYFLFRARPLGRSLLLAAPACATALALASPQIYLTARLMGEVSRQNIPYAVAGENSFFPLAAVLALFPMLMGTRTPGFYPQQWWGPWHLCEMLGYVGLLTLVLAGVAAVRLWRRRYGGQPLSPATGPACGVVRTWLWIALGASIWMLGYYLPTYRLVHALPVLGVLRCPARMVVAVEMALATLAAVTVHMLIRRRPGANRARKLGRSVRRGVFFALPAAMAAALVLVHSLTWYDHSFGFWLQFYFTEFGWAGPGAETALSPFSPAVWVPPLLLILSAAACVYWLRWPRRRAWLPVAVLVIDLLSITPFVDVPGSEFKLENLLVYGDLSGLSEVEEPPPDPQVSPAAAWLKANAPEGRWRVWGLGNSYSDRPAELLLPKVAPSLGIATINGYGPFHSRHHAHLLGFDIFGRSAEWRRLIRTNYLLSLYRVRYLVSADWEYNEVIESVRIPERSTSPRENEAAGSTRRPSANLWDEESFPGEEVRIPRAGPRDPRGYRFDFPLDREGVYRLSFLARRLGGEPSKGLYGHLVPLRKGPQSLTMGFGLNPTELHFAHLGNNWRRFGRTFRSFGANVSARVILESYGDAPIELKNVSVEKSHWPRPVNFKSLPPGARVYRKVAELAPVGQHGGNVAIYENRLCLTEAEQPPLVPPDERRIEDLRWNPPRAGELDAMKLPRLGVQLDGAASTAPWLWLSLPVAAALLALAVRRAGSGTSPGTGRMQSNAAEVGGAEQKQGNRMSRRLISPLAVAVVLAAGAAIWFVLPPVAARIGAALGAREASHDPESERGEPPAEDFLALRRVAAEVRPAVVKVRALSESLVLGTSGAGDRGSLGRVPDGALRRQYSPTGLGSGVVIDARRGLVLTNHHVVSAADRVEVGLPDGRTVEAQWVRSNRREDLAVVKIDAPDLTQAAFGDSDELAVGDWVLAIGAPRGLAQTVTAGIVSARARAAGTRGRLREYIQTDAAINKGNSGGPLVDARGRVVGINTAIVSESGGDEGIGFAIPSNKAREVAEELAGPGG